MFQLWKKKLCRAVGRSTFSFYFIEIFYTEIVVLTKISPIIQNSFLAIHNKMFRAGAKTLVVFGNLKHISGGERGGSVVECRTPEREVGGSKPTAALLCP